MFAWHLFQPLAFGNNPFMSEKPIGPLSGVVVVDLTRVLAGPYATLMLNELGARIIKVEPPKIGDDSRHVGPFVKTPSGKTKSGYYMSVNRGKQSIALNLKADADRKIFEALLARADVLIENYRGGTMEKLGYGYESLKHTHPTLIYCGVSGFGHTGPYAKRPVIGIVAALYDRKSTGRGQKIDISMLDCQVALLENAIARYVATGKVPERLGSRHPSIAPFAAFATKDGHIAIAAGNDELFARVAKVLGHEAMVADPRFASNLQRVQHHEALHERMELALSKKPSKEWLALLDAAGVPSGPLNNVAQVMEDPQVLHRNMIVTALDPELGPVRMQGNPVKMSAYEDPKTRPAASELDADRAAILSWLAAKA
jgi:CoA:oxalate CoA-transferase